MTQLHPQSFNVSTHKQGHTWVVSGPVDLIPSFAAVSSSTPFFPSCSLLLLSSQWQQEKGTKAVFVCEASSSLPQVLSHNCRWESLACPPVQLLINCNIVCRLPHPHSYPFLLHVFILENNQRTFFVSFSSGFSLSPETMLRRCLVTEWIHRDLNHSHHFHSSLYKY